MITLRQRLLGAACFLAGISGLSAANSSDTVYFQNWSDGTYTQSMATTDWNDLGYWDGSSPNCSVYTYSGTYKGLRVKMPAGAYNANSGMNWTVDIAGASDYTFEYKVLFETGFEFSKGNSGSIYGGGKLPGLAAGSQPSGCNKKTDGMSSRIMFRKDPDHNGGAPYIELYLYWRNQAGSCGDSIVLQGVTTNTWYTIKQRVRLGTASSDGNVTIWVNGTQKLSRNYRFLASGASWQINGILMHSFMGGNDSNWAPNSDRYLILDNFKYQQSPF